MEHRYRSVQPRSRYSDGNSFDRRSCLSAAAPTPRPSEDLTFDNYYRLIDSVMKFEAEQFRRLCGEHGLAVTHQRQVIYQALMLMHDHPSPEAVYEKVRKQIPSISLATVYKNIKTFVDSGLLREEVCITDRRG